MFGSNSAFGQSSPFGSQSAFGQNNNPSSNQFGPNPFGSTSPFGSQTGGSIFGNTSTGVFGATPSSSPFSSTTAFGASSSPAFGASTPAFGSSSASTGGSSLFGQNPASPFGGFGSNTQSSPFGSTFQQSQPAFGNSLFGSSSPFGASSQPSFGATSTPAFGSSSTPTFGSTSSPGFGASSTPAFGSTATTAFGNTGTAFGVSNTPVFGASSSPAFGASGAPAFGASGAPAFGGSSAPAFGTSSTSAFGASSIPAFGTSSTPAFGASSSPSFNFGSTSAFGQSSSAFGSSSPFGSTASPFGAQSSSFGAQATTPTFGGSTFGQTTFGGQQGGSRVVQYAPTTDPDSASGTQPGKLESISSMPAYKDKSHEELRWEDFQRGDKGGPSAASQPSAGVSFGVSAAQSNPFASSSTFGQSSSNPFSSPASSNPFATKPSAFGSQGFGTPSTTAAFASSPFGGSSTSNPFGSTSAAGSSIFGQSTAPTFASTSSTSIFGQSSSSPFGSSASLFGSASAPGSTPSFASGLSFANTQTPSLFPSTTPSLGQTGSAFGQTGSTFGQTASSFGQTSSPFGSSTLFNSSSAFGSSLFSSSPSPLTTSNTLGFSQSTPSLFQASQPAQSSSAFNFSNFGQTQPTGASGFGGGSSMFGQSFGQTSASQNPVQPVAVVNPFGTLPAMPQMSIGSAGTSPSIQYGISSMPVVDKPAPVRISSLLTSRHLSQRRIKLPARKYHPKSDSLKVPFFRDDEEAPNTPKADALLIPRGNPRALVIRPRGQWPATGNLDNSSALKDGTVAVHENGKIYEKEDYHFSNGRMSANNETPGENGSVKGPTYFERATHKANDVHDNNETQKGDSYITLTGHRAGEAAIVYEHGADIEAMMPKLWHSDYYTQPRIQELAAKERADPGYCQHVKDFVIGRHGYGSIKFLGETDVRRLDLESLIQFNNREVIVYMDDSKKPPVGQGLNKPAEVTLLNIKCYDKKTGQQYTEGPKIERYKEMLKKKAEDQCAEFLSYDPVKGEWKFKVDHFSRYNFGNDEDVWENVDFGAGAPC